MYVIINKDRVILGILPWNSKYFVEVLKIRHNIITELPRDEPDSSKFPYVIDDETVIKKAEEDRQQQINPLIEYYYGPTWEFVDDKVIAHYEVRPLTLEDAKINYKDKAANIRYNNEISGTTITIDGNNYEIETSRESRTKYIEKYAMMDDGPINWKFKEGWQLLTRQNMFDIIRSIDNHIQLSFDTEFNLITQINNSLTIEDLLSIELLNEEN